MVIRLIAVDHRHDRLAFIAYRCIVIIQGGDVFIISRFRFEHGTRTVFTSIDSQNGSHRHGNITRDTAEARVEADFVISQFQITHGARSNIQNDLSVARILHRHLYVWQCHIHNQVWSQLVIQQPLIERPQQVRATRR